MPMFFGIGHNQYSYSFHFFSLFQNYFFMNQVFFKNLLYILMYIGGFRAEKSALDPYEESQRKALFIGSAIVVGAFISTTLFTYLLVAALPSFWNPLIYVLPLPIFLGQVILGAGIRSKNKRALLAQLAVGLVFTFTTTMAFKDGVLGEDAEHLVKQEIRQQNAELAATVSTLEKVNATKKQQRSDQLSSLQAKASEWSRLEAAELNGIKTSSNHPEISYSTSGNIGDGNKVAYCHTQSLNLRREIDALKERHSLAEQSEVASMAAAKTRSEYLQEDENQSTFLRRMTALIGLLFAKDRVTAIAAWTIFILLGLMIWCLEFMPFILKYFNISSGHEEGAAHKDTTLKMLNDTIHTNHCERLDALMENKSELYQELRERTVYLEEEAYCYEHGDYRSFIPPPPAPVAPIQTAPSATASSNNGIPDDPFYAVEAQAELLEAAIREKEKSLEARDAENEHIRKKNELDAQLNQINKIKTKFNL